MRQRGGVYRKGPHLISRNHKSYRRHAHDCAAAFAIIRGQRAEAEALTERRQAGQSRGATRPKPSIGDQAHVVRFYARLAGLGSIPAPQCVVHHRGRMANPLERTANMGPNESTLNKAFQAMMGVYSG